MLLIQKLRQQTKNQCHFKMNNIKEITALTIEWAQEKGIINCNNRHKQFAQFCEEIGETFDEKEPEKKKLEFGDVCVTLAILSADCEIDFNDCFLARDIVVSGNQSELLHSYKGKLAKGLKYTDIPVIKASITKIIGIFHVYANYYGFELVDCFAAAYEKISKRKTQTINGIVYKTE